MMPIGPILKFFFENIDNQQFMCKHVLSGFDKSAVDNYILSQKKMINKKLFTQKKLIKKKNLLSQVKIYCSDMLVVSAV